MLLNKPITLRRGKAPIYEPPLNRSDIWIPCRFTVPFKTAFGETTRERVEALASKYRRRAAEGCVARGYEVLELVGPTKDKNFLATAMAEEDEVPYVIWAYVRKEPKPWTGWVPDSMADAVEKAGLKRLN